MSYLYQESNKIHTLHLADTLPSSITVPLPLLFMTFIYGINWIICPAEFLIVYIWLIISSWHYLTCFSIFCVSCKPVVRFKILIEFIFKSFWQEYFIGGALYFQLRHIENVMFGCPGIIHIKMDQWI